MEQKCISRYNLVAEFHIVNLHEICRVFLGIVHSAQHKQTSGLCHSLNLEHSWHHRLLREMALEEGFVAAHILQTNDVAVTDLNYLIYKKKRITVWQ